MEDDPLPRSSDTGKRVYIGNLPPSATRADIENHFNTHGTGKISEIKLMNGFGFIEYQDHLDARDVVPSLHGTDFMGQRLTVQFARGGRDRDPRGGGPGFYNDRERVGPRTRRTVYRMNMSGLPSDCSWQDLKDFARIDGLDVVYSEIPRERDGTGFVEYETEDDLKAAVEKMDGSDFRGSSVSCVVAIQTDRPRDTRYRSRSPPPFRRGPPRGYEEEYYDRRGPPPPPRAYSNRGYRERSPPRAGGGGGSGGYYDDRGYGGGGHSPPPPRARAPPMGDDYPPFRGSERRPGYPTDDYPPPARGYSSRGPPGYDAEPYSNGSRGGYPPSPPPARRRSPGPRGGGGGGYDSGYERPRY